MDALPALRRALEKAPPAVQEAVRVSEDVEEWVADLARRRSRAKTREKFLEDVRAGKRSLDVLKVKLYPYQEEGMLHLAFGERALLADEMGLGKTIQAIAACELLRQLRRIERVLVVSPASLKAEWEEQIGRFTDLPVCMIVGTRAERLRRYRRPAFFYLCNYEQVLMDVDEMNSLVAPDVVILDEAQRIKNWHTLTARKVKSLGSPYAFVLTGTPLENRIDEVYSIVEFLDPAIFGSLFRFNRDFYVLDEKGRPEGLKNLSELHRRLRPIMHRRRKDEVEDQLPPRTMKTFFVGMEPEQRERYQEYSDRVARLLSMARRRPLSPEEFERLQKWLACMRMLCDTPAILDPSCRICPKLDELAHVLEDVFQSGESKVIVFSEWERMLALARDLVRQMKVDFAWHTGTVPQVRRRTEINRFKKDATCRVFLSTDSGATGLNLQAANVVINLDLPWNPAKLEQRIARAWRKHQTRSVNVINLVTEESIEHRMLGMLEQKQRLADGVLDGRGDLAGIKLPSGRTAFVERLATLMGVEPIAPPKLPVLGVEPLKAEKDPFAMFREDVSARLSTRLLRLEAHASQDGGTTLLMVVDAVTENVRPLAERLLQESFRTGPAPMLELMDRSTFEMLRRLSRAGVVRLETEKMHVLHEQTSEAVDERRERARRREAAQPLLAEARRKKRMSLLLREGGFPRESLPSLRETVELTLKAAACLAGTLPDHWIGEVPLSYVETHLVPDGWFPAESAAATISRLRDAMRPEAAPAAPAVAALCSEADGLLMAAEKKLAS